MYGIHPVQVDPEENFPVTRRPPYNFRRLEDALEHPDLKDLQKVWLDPEAPVTWDGIEIPKENVLFLVGDDMHGFGDFVKDGLTVKMVPPDPKWEGEWFASMVVPLLLFKVYQT